MRPLDCNFSSWAAEPGGPEWRARFSLSAGRPAPLGWSSFTMFSLLASRSITNGQGFHYPIFMTLVHLVVIFCLSALTRRILQLWTGKPRVVLKWAVYFRKVAPTAMATALDIGLSNWSFLFITISLYTMTKSSAVLFILFFSLIFKLEEPNPFLILVVLLISCGLFMFTFHSTQFNMEGFIMVLLAAFIGGIRWTLTQLLMQKAELGLQNPIDAMYHLQPLMFLGLFPLFLYNEALNLSMSEKLFRVTELRPLLYSLFTLTIGGLLAFGLGFSEFLLVSKTSSLTLSISGIFKCSDRPGARFKKQVLLELRVRELQIRQNSDFSVPEREITQTRESGRNQARFKKRVRMNSESITMEVCTLLLAASLMGDELSMLNWLGFAVCLCGISLHVGLKTYYSKNKLPSLQQHNRSSELALPLLRQDSDQWEDSTADEDKEQEMMLN